MSRASGESALSGIEKSTRATDQIVQLRVFGILQTDCTEQLIVAVELRGEHGTAFFMDQTEQPSNFFHIPSKST